MGVDVDLLDDKQCQNTFKNWIDSTHICKASLGINNLWVHEILTFQSFLLLYQLFKFKTLLNFYITTEYRTDKLNYCATETALRNLMTHSQQVTLTRVILTWVC